MRIRSILLSSVAIVAAFAASDAYIGDAMAQRGGVLSPYSDWTVSKIDTQADPYCALARQFNPGVVMTMARNEAFETSFALSFNVPVLTVGGNVQITLDPGAGQQRVFNVTPPNDKAFVVRLGRDIAFFKAMERTGMIRAEVGGQTFNFDVADMDKGQYKLDACVANLVIPAAGTQSYAAQSVASVVPTPAAAPVVQVARVPLVKAPTQVDAFDREINALRDQVEALQEKNNKLSKQKPVQVASNNEAFEKLQRENLYLKNEVQSIEAQSSFASELEKEIETLRAKNKVLEEVAFAQDLKSDDQEALKSQLKTLVDDNNALKQRLEIARLNVRNEFEARVANLEEENARLVAQAASGKTQVVKVNDEFVEQLQQQIAKVESENRVLQLSAAKAKGALEEKLQQEQNVATALPIVEKANDRAQILAELNTVQDTLNDKTAKLEALQRAHSEKKALIVELEGSEAFQKNVIEDLKNKLEKAVANNKAEALVQNTAHNDELLTLKSDNEALKAKLDGLEGDVSRIASLERDLVALQGRNSALRSDLMSVGNLDAEKDTLRSQLQEALAQNETLEKAAADNNLQLAELSGLKDALAQEKRIAAQAEVERKEAYKVIVEKLSVVEQQRDELKSILSDVVALAELYREKNKVQAAYIAKLEADNRRLELEISQMDTSERFARIQTSAGDYEIIEEPVEKTQDHVAESVAVKQDAEVVNDAPNIVAPIPPRKPYTKLAQAYEVANDAAPVAKQAPFEPARDVVAAVVKEKSDAQLSEMNAAQKQEYLLKRNRELELQKVEANKISAQREAEELALQARLEREASERAGEQLKEANAVVVEQPLPNVIEDKGLAVSDIEREPISELDKVIADQAEKRKNATAHSQLPVKEEIVEASVVTQEPQEPKDASSVASWLSRADIVEESDVKTVGRSSEHYSSAYQWNSEKIFGSAEQKPLNDPYQFDALVQEYLERTQSRCSGDFAIVPDQSFGGGDLRADSYEVACVGESVSSGASLLFFNEGSTFNVIAHEAPTQQLGVAMQLRNKVMRLISGQS